MTTTLAESANKHCFVTFYVPWSDLSAAYVPEIYDQYTQDYIDLSVTKHKELADSFNSDYVFVNDTDYCESLFLKYDIPRLGHNDIFNIKFMLLEELFARYETITYIDFDIIQIGQPQQKDISALTTPSCAIRYTEPLPGKQVYEKTVHLCKLFNIEPSREVWQNNNGVITLSKQIWQQLDYINSLKVVYNTAQETETIRDLSGKEFAYTICDETMFNFLTMYKNINVTRLQENLNILVRNEQEFQNAVSSNNDFCMMHFTKHTGKEILNRELRNKSSILY
jgi:hypothetical protein